MNNKKLIIIDESGGRLANRLWIFASVYAYCLERGYACADYSFYHYQNLFGIHSGNWLADNILAGLPRRLGRVIYLAWVKILRRLNPKRVVESGSTDFLLPPSLNTSVAPAEQLNKLETGSPGRWYLSGWLWRNPVGFTKYRTQILNYFKPKAEINNCVEEFVKKARVSGRRLVGVHIRHGDYKTWQGGKYYFSFSEARRQLDNFLARQSSPGKIKFILCSDEKIDRAAFAGLNYVLSLGSPVEDLYTLGACDLIIGSNSTFGSWAAYYGNVQFIKFSHSPVEWPKL